MMVPSGHELEEKMGSKKLMMKNNIAQVRSRNQNNKNQVFLGSIKERKALGKYRNIFAFRFLKDKSRPFFFCIFLPTVLCTFCHIL